MTEASPKRRKIRPNNPISKEKLSNLKSESNNETKLAEKAQKKAVKAQRKAEKKAQRKTEKKTKQPEEKKKRTIKSKGEFKETELVVEKETTKEAEQPIEQQVKVSHSVEATPIPDPDTDSKTKVNLEDNEKAEIIEPNDTAIINSIEEDVSMEDMTPMEADIPTKESTSTVDTIAPIDNTSSSSSDSDEEPEEKTSANPKKRSRPSTSTTNETSNNGKYRTKAIIYDSDSDSDSSSNEKNQDRKGFVRSLRMKQEHLSANRISFRRKKEYDSNLSAAENIKGRLNDLFVPNVKDDDFISESDSEPDSGEDYETKEYPSWQRTLGLKHKEDDPWPKQRKFGYSDKLKLEKRVKKVCKREGLSFEEARDIFTSSKRGPHIRLFQKIAKIFPNMTLHALAKQLKVMYHTKRVSTPWTDEEIERLQELIKVYGTSPTKLSEHLDRSPKNISDFMYNNLNKNLNQGPKKNKRWTEDEDLIIAEAAAKLEKNQTLPAASLVPKFNGTRTPKQILRRYHSIRHLIQKDGTVAKKRKATLNEELQYLQSLLKQATDLGLIEESQLDYSKDRGFVAPSFYLKSRCTINGFETMDIKEILQKLIKRQERIIESRRIEQALDKNK